VWINFIIFAAYHIIGVPSLTFMFNVTGMFIAYPVKMFHMSKLLLSLSV